MPCEVGCQSSPLQSLSLKQVRYGLQLDDLVAVLHHSEDLQSALQRLNELGCLYSELESTSHTLLQCQVEYLHSD